MRNLFAILAFVGVCASYAASAGQIMFTINNTLPDDTLYLQLNGKKIDVSETAANSKHTFPVSLSPDDIIEINSIEGVLCGPGQKLQNLSVFCKGSKESYCDCEWFGISNRVQYMSS